MAKADHEVRASLAQLGMRVWGAEAQERGKESNLLCSASALQSWERLCAPWPAQFPLLSLKDIPRLGCDKEMRCLSSRGLAEPAALWRASTTAECGATGHCSSTESERLADMSSSPFPEKLGLRDSGLPANKHLLVRCQCYQRLLVAASTHQNGWSQEGHPEGYFNVFLSRPYLTGSFPTTCCESEDAQWIQRIQCPN